MVDKAIFPREKVCGDGLTPRGVRAMQKIGLEPSDPGFVQVAALRTYGVDGFVADYAWPKLRDFPAVGVVRTRFTFHTLRARGAVEAGATLERGGGVPPPLPDGGRVVGAI